MKPSLQDKLDQDHNHGIDLTPVIDMVFILLIFFIVTTAFTRETGVEVEKPSAATAQQLDDDLILIAITAGGDVVHDGSNIGVDGVRSTVQALLLTQDRPVVLQADRQVPTELLVRVMDQAKLGGATTLNLAAVAQ
jgi:biopolymer transport protein ExbD